MYSNSYNIYECSYYFSLLLTVLVWVMWIAGLFFGKIVVVDFMLALQIGVLCIMTTGILGPGFSGMMV